MAAIFHPFLFFNDKDGLPLDNGTIYFGTPNLNPVTNPVPVFFDNLFTLPAQQPIKTLNGYASNNGQPTSVYASVQVSIAVFNKIGELVYYVGSTVIPIGLQGIQGVPGLQGIQGNPTLWRTGSGVPANSLGINGDLYLNVVNGDVYQKAGGVYTLQANIRGLPGTNGTNGINGTNGTNAVVFKQIDVSLATIQNNGTVDPIIFTSVIINDASMYNTGIYTAGRTGRVHVGVTGTATVDVDIREINQFITVVKNATAASLINLFLKPTGIGEPIPIVPFCISRIIDMQLGDTLKVRVVAGTTSQRISNFSFSVTELT